MKIFISYKREDEKIRDALILRLKTILPDAFEFWTDVKRLRWGSNFPQEIENAILKECDFFICLVSDRAGGSEWMGRELALAKRRENEQKRGFILPIVVEGTARNALWAALDLDVKNYVEISPYDAQKLDRQTERIKDLLFQLICTDMEKHLHPSLDDKIQNIAGNGKWLAEVAQDVLAIVFPHRSENPIAVDDLAGELHARHAEITPEGVPDLIDEMLKAKLLSGIDYDGDEMYLVEEHASWNNAFRASEKERIAKYAFNEFIKKKRAKTIYIDAGSTALELVLRICNYFKSPSNTLELTVITPSTELLQLLSDTCLALGYTNDARDGAKLRLIVPGGYIHTATQTIVQWNEQGRSEISSICKNYGLSLDAAFIGANGITVKGGIMTYSNEEDHWKRDAISIAKKTILICDSGKFGVTDETLNARVIDWEDDFVLVCDRNENNAELAAALAAYGDKIVLT